MHWLRLSIELRFILKHIYFLHYGLQTRHFTRCVQVRLGLEPKVCLSGLIDYTHIGNNDESTPNFVVSCTHRDIDSNMMTQVKTDS